MTIAVPSLRAVVCAPGWVRNDLWRRARAVPSLDLRFADSKSLVDAVTGQNLITFTRASSGTFVDSAGVLQTAAAGVPRFDHNPTTGASLGLLIEDQRVNLLLNSEALDTYVVAAGSVSANQGVAPDGTFSADEITSTGGGAYQSVSGVTASTTYTASVYAKYVSGGSGFSFGCDVNPSEARVLFNLQAGTTSAIGANVVSHSMTLVGNGWYRCAVTFVATSTSLIFALYNAISGSKWLCWGAQLEAGAFPTSYIPTTGSAATRNADVVSITGANFSSWYRQDEGTVFCGAREYPFASSATRTFYGFENSSQVNTDWHRQWIWSGNTTALFHSIYTASSGPIAADFQVPLVNEQKHAALAYRVNDFARSYNGATPATDSSGNLPVGIDRVGIGSNNGALQLNGHIRRFTYWPQRLSDATLQAITL